MTAALILFQGSEDKVRLPLSRALQHLSSARQVVPPSQSEIIRDACQAKGLKCKYVPLCFCVFS
jgi:hypothetical protein